MNFSEKQERKRIIREQLIEFDRSVTRLPGISREERLSAFLEQIIDSISRIEYVYAISRGNHSEARRDPSSTFFDPLKAAVLFRNEANFEEACWLVFLAVHFGKSVSSGWRLARDFYGGLGGSTVWRWDRVTQDFEQFEAWCPTFYGICQSDGVVRKFGNHRKYESLDPRLAGSVRFVVKSYIAWVHSKGSHSDLFSLPDPPLSLSPRDHFFYLYNNMSVLRFGRTGKFDFLTMIAKLGLADLEPDSTFIKGSTGPIAGARLLLSSSASNKWIDEQINILSGNLSIGRLGMQVLEDALCNWQKAPARYIRFKG